LQNKSKHPIFDIVKRLQTFLKLFIMDAFLITSKNGVSEFKYNFVDVQIEMNRLEKIGIVSNVKVSKFENSILVKEFTYNYNGEEWENK